MKNKIFELIKKNTEFQENGFSINIENDMKEWDACLQELGLEEGYHCMANSVCSIYKEIYGQEFLFSNECVAHEIAYHANCFFLMKGFKGYTYNTAAIVLPKDMLIERCRIIDIYTSDINSLLQSTVFNYRHGIRDCYKRTEKDPFYKK